MSLPLRRGVAGAHPMLMLRPCANPVEVVTGDGVQRYDVEPLEHVQQPVIQSVVDELRGHEGKCSSAGVGGGTCAGPR